MKRLSIVIVIVILANGCAMVKKPLEQSPSHDSISLDDKFVETAKLIPGFRGMYFDNDGNLNVYLLGGMQRLNGEGQWGRAMGSSLPMTQLNFKISHEQT
jgi:hypothetical protein